MEIGLCRRKKTASLSGADGRLYFSSEAIIKQKTTLVKVVGNSQLLKSTTLPAVFLFAFFLSHLGMLSTICLQNPLQPPVRRLNRRY